MDWTDLEKHFSPARLGRYRTSCGGDTVRAAQSYVHNLTLAAAMIPMLSVLEIALKNGVHRRLSSFYQRPDWWESWGKDALFARQRDEVTQAKLKLQRRAELATPDKVVAELAFGFWSSLFNKQFQGPLWHELRLVFPRCPKPLRQRHTVSAALNQMRDLRNRVFHHEQLLWLTPSLPELHARGVAAIAWLDPKLVPWLASFDGLPATWAAMQKP